MLIDKIKSDDDYVVFQSNWCGYSQRAVSLLYKMGKRGVTSKIYEIDEEFGSIDKLLEQLSDIKNKVDYDTKHKTRPIIFYHGKFIGGYQELETHINKKLEHILAKMDKKMKK